MMDGITVGLITILWLCAVSPTTAHDPGPTNVHCVTHVAVLSAGCNDMLPGATFASSLGQPFSAKIQGPGLYRVHCPCGSRITVSVRGYQSQRFVLDRDVHGTALFLDSNDPRLKLTVNTVSRCSRSLEYVSMTPNGLDAPGACNSLGVCTTCLCKLPVNVAIAAPGHVNKTVTITTKMTDVVLECDDTSLQWTLSSSCGSSLIGTRITLNDRKLSLDQTLHLPAVRDLETTNNIVLTCRTPGSWNPWIYRGTCPVTCGGGTRLRERSCSLFSEGLPCEGAASDTEDCNTHLCSVDGNWGPWICDSPCSATCGGGTETRVRVCNNPIQVAHGLPCVGLPTESAPCNTHTCPVDGVWAAWTAWSDCLIKCSSNSRGYSREIRTRTCTNPAPSFGGAICPGDDTDYRPCPSYPCQTCKQVLLANPTARSGEYVLVNDNEEEFRVFCVFLGGYGYTFLSPDNTVTDIDIASLYTTAEEVAIVHRRTDGQQRGTLISQIEAFSQYPLSIQYSQSTGFNAPLNADNMGPYVFVGFLPQNGFMHNGLTEGYASFDRDNTFTNCDGNPNSHFTFLFNQGDNTRVDYSVPNAVMFPWIDDSIDLGLELLPVNYFSEFESHFGGCGGYIDVTDTALSGAAVGLRFNVDAVDSINMPSLCACAAV